MGMPANRPWLPLPAIAPPLNRSFALGINKQSDVAANIQIGPTTEGMVRIYIEGDGVDLPLDFDADEAEEIAEELRAAADAARRITDSAAAKAGPKGGKPRR